MKLMLRGQQPSDIDRIIRNDYPKYYIESRYGDKPAWNSVNIPSQPYLNTYYRWIDTNLESRWYVEPHTMDTTNIYIEHESDMVIFKLSCL